ncbi:MAG: radical SAM protein [Bacteroidales bacterium]|nr:radical SAM protein [Bacteroidales bacterium]
MDRIKKFISLYVPVTTCTLRCHYCYITQTRAFEGKLPQLKFSPETIKKALSKKRLGGTCLINICGGGETLLPSQIVDYTRVLLEEGHYVMIVTNATTTQRFIEIAKFPKELLNRLFFKFSFHYLELKAKKILEVFFDNVLRMRDSGASFTLEVTPTDELVPYIDDMCDIAVAKVGAVPHITIARDQKNEGTLPVLTKMGKKKYYETWDRLKSSLFEYKKEIFGVKRTEFCYAGAYSGLVNLGTGLMTQCYCSYYSQNIFKDINKPIKFTPVGNNCALEHCYNGHAFLVLGVIPELRAPTYGEIRNKKCVDGTEWLKPDMKNFMNTRLYESNEELSNYQKTLVNFQIKKTKAMQYLINSSRRLKNLIPR